MIRFGMIWGLARAEMRLTRRLVRYWVFLVLSTLAVAFGYAQFYFIHYFFSAYSASAASANPRYFVGSFGSQFVMIFLIGLVFLGFEVRARDTRERMVEVLDALPVTNLELVLGKALGILIACWVPVVVISGLLLVVGLLLGNSIEPWSMITFVIFMSLPAYVFTIGLVFFLALVLRHRLLASVVALIVLVAAFVVSLWWVPFYVTPAIDVSGGYSIGFPSDILPEVITIDGIAQRLVFMLGGFGFLWFAAALHPRKDDGSRSVRLGGGAAVFLVAAVLCWGLVAWLHGPAVDRDGWSRAHEAKADEPVPDLLSITGDVRIDPGSRLHLGLNLRFSAPETSGMDAAIFTLNPGLDVQKVDGPSGQALDFSKRNGLLEVGLPGTLPPGEEMSIDLVARGEIDTAFAYLDAPFDLLEITPVNAQVMLLGYESAVFERRYVALMPGVRWLPAPGPESGRGDPKTRPTDFHDLDLTVDVPEGWIVAGPGRRREPAQPAAEGRVRYRFAPPAPLPEVALVAGRFESRGAEIEGVRLEMLMHPSHVATVDFFEDAAAEIESWLGERLAEAAELGLGYPYDALTVVEVPNLLRGYGGGWRMDSTMVQPAMILMRESGFPTARFSRRAKEFEEARDQEGGTPRAKREGLELFFENDINGGNPFIAAARSFLGFQTAGSGPEGIPLDFVLESLTSKLIAERDGYFSVHFFDQDFGQSFSEAAMGMDDADRVGETYSEVLLHLITSTTEVWDTALGVSLVQLDPWEDPKRTINVLNLKGGAMARSMLDGLGREKTGQVLGALRSRTAGSAYGREDLVAAGREVDEDLESWLSVWIDETDLPGFRLGEVSVQRISDAEDGSSRYQLLATVRNEEEPPGLLRLEYQTEGPHGPSQRLKSDPVQLPGRSAVEIGLVTDQPLRNARVAPYFALNRDPFAIPLPELDREEIVEAEPFTGARPVEWSPGTERTIVVDDLDPGFGLEERTESELLRVSGRGGDEVLDQGLPISSTLKPARWSRMAKSYAFGRYRRTMAVVRSGRGERQAVFTAELPHAGEWELEYYLPRRPAGKRAARSRPGTWKLTIVDESGEQEISFDADAGESGWNSLGTFEIAGGETRLLVSDESDGDYVVADAIRWAPMKREIARLGTR